MSAVEQTASGTAERNEALIEFLETRRSVPAKVMGGPGPDPETLISIIRIAARVPDHGKIAPWRFVQYTPETCKALGEKALARAMAIRGEALNEEESQIELTRFTRAPVVIGIISAPRPHPKVPEWEQILSSAAAAMNMLLAANAHGYDAQWLTEWVAFDEELLPHFGVGEGERITGFIHIGTRTMPKTERDRPSLEDVFVTL